MFHHGRLCIAFLTIYMCIVVADRTSDKIYYDCGNNGLSMCFRRLNATHQFGSSSERNGNVGILHYVQSEPDIQWVTSLGPHSPYVVLLDSVMLTLDTVQRFIDSNKVNGILVRYNRTHHQNFFSPDLACPNANFELYRGDEEYSGCKKNVWNPNGNGLIFKDIPIPVLTMTNETHVDFFINDCFRKYNLPTGNQSRDYPLCGAEVLASMDAVKDTPTCLRKGEPRNLNPADFCDPLGDKNVYGFLHPIRYNETGDQKHSLRNESLIVASAKLDVASLFEHMYPGAEATVVGFVSLLAAAEALGNVKDTIDPETDRPIMFTFFQGEAFDYMGSSRMVRDMVEGEFPYRLVKGSEGPHPIHPYHIGDYFEISQVGLPQDGSLWVHSDPRSRRDPDIEQKVKDLENVLSELGAEVGLEMKATDKGLPLPPASLHTFLRQSNFSAVVIADHNEHFNNKYYSGRYDLYDNLDYDVNVTANMTVGEMQTVPTELSKHLTNLATVVARSLYKMSTGRNGSVNVNETLVSQLLFCFFWSPRCELFNQTSADKEEFDPLQEKPFEFYVGISRIRNPITHHVSRLLAYFLGTDRSSIHENETACKEAESPFFQYQWMQGPVNSSDPAESRVGVCMESTVNKSSAKSPAFLDGYDWESNLYPAWTESVWPGTNPNIRVFLIPSRQYEIRTLCVGLAVIVVSFPLVFALHRRAPVIFHTT